MASAPQHLRIAVIGGGISGVAAAHRLRVLLPHAELRLFEASDRLGGAVHTLDDRGLVLEQGADSFLAKSGVVVELCRALGLADELIPTNEHHRRAMVVCRGHLEPIPEGFVLMRPTRLGPMLRSPILSPWGKLRMLCEPLVPRHASADSPTHDESIADFAVRRLGRDVYERLVEPLMGGIYVGDAARLSLAATMPEFLEAERVHGSLWNAQQATANQAQSTPGTDATSGARYSAFLTLRRGLGSLIDALAASLPADAVQLKSPVTSLARENNRWQLATNGRPPESFDAVILAAPAPTTATLLAEVDGSLAACFGRIQCASSAVVTLVFKKSQLSRPLDAFGFVVPHIERRQILAASFPGVKFPGRGDDDTVPFRVFLGGVLRPELVDLADEKLAAIAAGELQQLLGIRGEPSHSSVARWRDAMPQYALGHIELVKEIERLTAAHPNLALAGNAYHGVGIPQCIVSGQAAATSLAAGFSNALGTATG